MLHRNDRAIPQYSLQSKGSFILRGVLILALALVLAACEKEVSLTAIPPSTLPWTTLTIDGETVHLLKVWQLVDPNDPDPWPEFAIVRAYTSKAKLALEDDTKLTSFLNGPPSVFSQPVRGINRRASLPSPANPCTAPIAPPPPPPYPPPHWDFIVIHGRASTANIVKEECF